MNAEENMNALHASRAIALGLAMLVAAKLASVLPDDDRASILYPKDLPGTIGCVDDVAGRVTWGCD
jgi:hypothetical protein